MNTHITHFRDNRSPSLYGTITIDGVAVNLIGSTVKLQMREADAVSGDPLVVDAAAVIVDAPTGQVRYDWAGADVDTAGRYLLWWRVTTGSLIQDTPESLFEILEHTQTGNEYISVGELKESLSLSDTTFADMNLADAVQRASRAVDGICGRRFYLGSVGEVKKYTPVSEDYLQIDDAVSITAVNVDGDAWVLNTHYVLESSPFSIIRVFNGNRFSPGEQSSVTVTGQFGYFPVPPEVKGAAEILAAKYLKRVREATFGVVGFGLDGGSSFLPLRDPDLEGLLAPYTRSAMIQ